MTDQSLRILLIEDNPGESRLVREHLRDDGINAGDFELVHASTLAAALDQLANDAFDLIVLDLSLPESAGIGAVTQLHAAAPAVPLVVLGTPEESDEPIGRPQDLLVQNRVDGETLMRSIRFAINRQQKLDMLARYDDLTGMPNSRFLREHTERMLLQARRYGMTFVVLYVDLCGFARFTTDHGTAVANDVLRTVAQRVKTLLRTSDLAARIEEHDFAIALPPASGPHDAVAVARKLLQSIGEPIAAGTATVTLDANIGAATYPYDGHALGELFAAADAAMYRAKRRGPGAVEIVAAPRSVAAAE